MSRTALRTVALFVCIVFSAVFAHAQYRASIQGVVTDQQGAVVPDANVTLTNLETNQHTKTNSDAKGIYNFYGLPPAKFSLTVEKGGFKTKTIESFGIVAEQANAINVQLDVGQAVESVVVNGDAAPLLDTESADVSGTVKASQFQALPSIGRDPLQLLQLAPGAFGDGAQSSGGGTNSLPASTSGGTGSTDGVFKIENAGQISANGSRVGDNNYTIDGVGTTSVTWGGTTVVTPNEDSIKEIKVVTDNYDAENGRYKGAQVEIISQNGTNTPHGSFFFKIHRPGLDAYTPYNGYANGNVRDANRFNDWGGTLGGPILKNHVFGFFSYETITDNSVLAPSSGWYETSAFRQLAASGTNASAFLSYQGVAANGGTQVDEPCSFINLVEGTNCHAIAGQGLNLGSPLTSALGSRDPGYQNNSNPGTGGDGSGGPENLGSTADIAFIENTNEPNTSTHRQYNGRVDFQATSRDLIAFSFYYVPNSSTSINGNGDRLMNLFSTTYKNRAATALWDHTFGSSMANEFRLNAAGWEEKDLSQNPNAPWGLPQVSFNQTGSVAFQGYGIGSFNGFDQWTFAGKDVFTKVHGAHTMKMGGEYTHLKSVDAPFWADRPGYTFNNMWDFLNDAPVAENAQFDPTNGVPSAEIKNLRNHLIGLFFQDDYKLRSNLTVTLGLRWDYFGPITERDGKLASVVYGSGSNEFTNMSVRTGGGQYNAQKANFGPQLGFAWSPRELVGHDLNNKMVFRGGIGFAYDGITQSNTLDVRFNPPYVNNGVSLNGSQILYINSFPSNVHSPYGYASNPFAITTFGSNNLPLSCPATTIQGQNPVTQATGNITLQNPCIDLTALPDNWPTEYAIHYTFGAEYDLGHNWVVSAGYQGSQTRHLLQHYNDYNTGAANGFPLNPLIHGVTLYNDNGSAHFNALLLEAKHTFSQSFQLDTQYRLAHSVDVGSNAYAGPYYQWNLGSALGTSDYNVKSAFKMYGVYSPTIYHGNNVLGKQLAGGWSISGILNAHTGFPWTPIYSYGDILPSCSVSQNGFVATGPCEPVFNYGPNGGGGSADAGSSSFQPTAYSSGFRPNFRSSVTNTNGGQAYFTPPTVPAGTLFQCLFPNADYSVCPGGVQQSYAALPSMPGIARNSFGGPGYFDIDATLSKSFGLPPNKILGEAAKLEIRANFYNLFNKLNLYNPQNDIYNPNFGEAQSALGSRTIEMQARFSF